MTVIRIIKIIVKILLLIIVSPFILLWFFFKHAVFKSYFVNALKKEGVAVNQAKEISKEINLMELF